jgi:four helix bundle protein
VGTIWIFVQEDNECLSRYLRDDSGMSDFRDLKVWQKAHAVMLAVHEMTDRMRVSKFAALKGQMNRAAESIPANIVEGRSQESWRVQKKFLRIALNSATELEYHLIAARDLKAISSRDHDAATSQVIEIRKMLYGLIRYLDSRAVGAPKT